MKLKDAKGDAKSKKKERGKKTRRASGQACWRTRLTDIVAVIRGVYVRFCLRVGVWSDLKMMMLTTTERIELIWRCWRVVMVMLLKMRIGVVSVCVGDCCGRGERWRQEVLIAFVFHCFVSVFVCGWLVGVMLLVSSSQKQQQPFSAAAVAFEAEMALVMSSSSSLWCASVCMATSSGVDSSGTLRLAKRDMDACLALASTDWQIAGMKHDVWYLD